MTGTKVMSDGGEQKEGDGMPAMPGWPVPKAEMPGDTTIVVMAHQAPDPSERPRDPGGQGGPLPVVMGESRQPPPFQLPDRKGFGGTEA